MKTCDIILLLVLVALPVQGQAQETAPLRWVHTIPLPQVEGRIDHLAVDLHGQRLFVAALGNNTVEVLDLGAGTHLHTITGLHEPQGVLFLPEFKRLVVTNGAGDTSEMFDADSFTRLQRLLSLADADNLRYDTTTKQIYIGYGQGALGMIAATDGRHLGAIPLAGHPESFQLEPSGPRIFVNVPAANHIAVVNRDTRAVMTTWPTPGARDNFPMALDDTHQRLFVGFRQPALLIVFDTASGQPVASLESAGDADDVFYDAARQRIYVSGGEGVLSVFAQRDADHYTPMARIPTAPGARTSLWVPDVHRLYLAVPHRGTQAAEIRVYDVQP